MKARLILTYIFNIIDLIVTMYLVRLFGLSIEGNPIGRWLIKANAQYFVKIVVIGIALMTIWSIREYTIANIASWILFITYFLLVIYHGIILLTI